MRRSSRNKIGTENGFVLITMAIVLPVLVALLGFAVDLGAWYLRATTLQRAADLAALSGATSFPDATAAKKVALESFKRNGLVDGGSITIEITVGPGSIQTKVTDNAVPTYFLKMLSIDMTLSRESEAKQFSAIPLGNPYNVFGAGDLAIDGVPKQNFWAAVNGTCSPKEDGDYFMAKWDANKSATGHTCPAPDFQKNPDFFPGGYAYAVDIPEGEMGPVAIDIWNSHFDIPNDLADDVIADDFHTSYAVWDTMGTASESDDQLRANKQVLDGQSPGDNVWLNIYTVPATSVAKERNYRVQVFTGPAKGMVHPETGAGVNSYAVMASVSGDHKGCDTRVAPDTCPKVYGLNAVSVLNSISGSSAEFYLGEIDQSFAGSTLSAFLWDPGEGAQSIELLAPDGTPMAFSWSATPAAPAVVPMSGSDVTKLDVSGVGPQPNIGIQGTSTFNDRLITMSFKVPSDYSAYVNNPSDYWWKVRYTTKDGIKVTDRTTWGLNVGENTPPYLARKQ